MAKILLWTGEYEGNSRAAIKALFPTHIGYNPVRRDAYQNQYQKRQALNVFFVGIDTTSSHPGFTRHLFRFGISGSAVS